MSGLFPSERTSGSTTTTTSGGAAGAGKLSDMAFAAGEQVPLTLPEGQRLTGAPANVDQFGGLQMQRTALEGISPDFGMNIIDLGNMLANPTINPLLPGAIDAASRPVLDFANVANQELLRGGEQFGAAGGSAVRLAQGQIASGTQRQLSDLASQLAFQTSEKALDRSLHAPSVLGQGFGLTQLPGQQLGQIGGQQRMLESIETNENLAQFRESQTAPFTALNMIANILSGLPFDSSSAGTNTQQLDPFMKFLQFILGAGAVGVGVASLASGNPAGALPFLNTMGNQPPT